ncbi:hypothetical protein LWI29_036405 [Acer saccharum]|uniref:Uncharacterized protein n=1 Tax=Acer saccharum TaxID=4024 RepID=A0AA39SYC2_ACESA|nr:hypothetical protein LWI29_036405 [Acer saccharum]
MGKDQRIATCIDILTAIFLPPLGVYLRLVSKLTSGSVWFSHSLASSLELFLLFIPSPEAGGGENDGGKAHAPPYCSGLRRLAQASSLFDDVRRLAVSTVWAVRASLLVELLTAGGYGENDDGKRIFPLPTSLDEEGLVQFSRVG